MAIPGAGARNQSDGNYRTNAVIRVKFPGHGAWTIGPAPVMVVTIDGEANQIAVTRYEWSHAIKPLLVKRDGEWFFGITPVEIRTVSDEAKIGMKRRWDRKNQQNKAGRSESAIAGSESS